MRLILTLCLSLCCFIPSVAQTIWNSNTVTFNKVALEDADPITQHVILTRGENKGIYNTISNTKKIPTKVYDLYIDKFFLYGYCQFICKLKAPPGVFQRLKQIELANLPHTCA